MISPMDASNAAIEPPAPTISVVLPTCDRREETLRCVRSLLSQTRPPLEVIVVDDGSGDGTGDAVEALAAETGPTVLRVLRNQRNLGANASRNRGVAEAGGELVAFLDSDCEADPRWLEHLSAPFADPAVGAVSGLAEDAPARNLWELAFRGTHRLPRPGPVSRFTSCNLCVRRRLLAGHRWEEDFSNAAVTAQGRADTSFSGRCDEEGLYLALRAAGWVVRAEPRALVLHDHPYTARSLMRQAWHGGRAAAELVWKFRLIDRLDVAPFAIALLAALAALPLAALHAWWWLLLPLPPLLAGIAAVCWNETANKGKRPGELVRAAPVLAIYYLLRTLGYLLRRVELLLRVTPIARIAPGSLGRHLPAPETTP
jgi:glycosyltransferase involved in cell wall biosynthesis